MAKFFLESLLTRRPMGTGRLPVKFGLLSCVFGLLAAAGCQPQTTAMLESPPPPSFNPPVVAQAPAPKSLPKPAHPPKTAKAPAPHSALMSEADAPPSWIPWAKPRPWKWIVIHHSATAAGGAARFDKMHRAKGWDELGYDFVIGNGTDTRDGQIEVGSRWPKQKWGAHAKTAREQYNNYGIGICLVGNFDIDRPTKKQMESLARLCAYMMITYHIPPDHVLGHRDTKATDCPGRNMNLNTVRTMAEADIRAWGYDPRTFAKR
jgi:hypothetical protein